jgi:hypothetical protein
MSIDVYKSYHNWEKERWREKRMMKKSIEWQSINGKRSWMKTKISVNESEEMTFYCIKFLLNEGKIQMRKVIEVKVSDMDCKSQYLVQQWCQLNFIYNFSVLIKMEKVASANELNPVELFHSICIIKN